jgi:hypothetical protein
MTELKLQYNNMVESEYLEGRDGPSLIDSPKLVRQQTLGETDSGKVEKWTYQLQAVNELVAKNAIRRYVRTNYPFIKNILDPEVDDISETEQGKLRQFFPETIQQEEMIVEVLVVR